jgi:hypothetical protein
MEFFSDLEFRLLGEVEEIVGTEPELRLSGVKTIFSERVEELAAELISRK